MGLTQKLGTIPLAIFTDASNNIGIGGSPSGSYKFEVTGNIRGTGTAYDLYTSSGIGSSAASGLLRVVTAGTSTGIAIGQANSSRYTAIQPNEHIIYNDDFFMRTNGAFPLSLGTNNTIRLSITSTGNVGIGTSSPQDYPNYRILHIAGPATNGSGLLYLTNSNNSIVGLAYAEGTNSNVTFGSQTNHPVRFVSNDTERMRITSGGQMEMKGAVRINNGTGGTSPILSFGTENETNAGFKGMYLEGYWMYVQVHYNEGLRIRATNGVGSTQNIATFSGASGNLSILGALSKGSGSFKIDHPIESMKDTHHLVHSFVESPQANNIYRGKAQLVNGTAQVNLDEVSTMTEGTFVLLNREIHTYTSNETDWDAVRGNVIGNILYIECQNNKSNALVSWLVIGERQDKHMMDTDWTDDNGKVIVEPLKEITPLENKS